MAKIINYLFGLSLLLLVVCCLAKEPMKVEVKDFSFKDEDGRVIVLHGMSLSLEDIWSANGESTPDQSLTDQDFDRMKSLGIKLIRLSVSWELAEPEKARYNETYFTQLQSVVQQAGKHDIQVILSFQQQLLSPKFCGSGFPSWVFESNSFPAPHNVDLKIDPNTKLPDPERCIQNQKLNYYLTQDVIQSASDLLTGNNGLHTIFGNFWKTLIKKVGKEVNVLGYELINELLENIPMTKFEEKKWRHFKGGDKINAKEYSKLIETTTSVIREFDQVGLIFAPSRLKASKKSTGLDVPREFKNKFSYAYQSSCKFYELDAAYQCRGDDAVINNKDVNLKNGNGAFLSEFSAKSSDSKDSNKEIEHIMSEADSRLFWRSIPNAAPIPNGIDEPILNYIKDPSANISPLIKQISRPYFYAICGQSFTRNTFNPERRLLTLEFKVGKCKDNVFSELYLNPELTYPHGYVIDQKNCPDCAIEPKQGGNGFEYILKSSKKVRSGKNIGFRLAPAESADELGILDQKQEKTKRDL